MSTSAGVVDGAALTEALQTASERCGRLTNDQVRALRRQRRGVATGLVGTGIAGVLACAVMLHQPATTAAPYTREVATRPGQRGMLTLVDGSTVKLDGATRVRIDYGAGRRTAELLAGQASFDIRHDSVRPFIVGAGSGEIRVLGTAFDLDLTGHRLKLAVYRGAVRFGSVAGQTRSVLVRAGYRSSLHDGAVADPERFDTTLPTWWGGWIDTNGMRLDEVVEVLNRQAGVSIAAPPEALSAVRVSGRFRIDRPAQILRAMGDGFGFTVVERNGKLVLRPNA